MDYDNFPLDNFFVKQDDNTPFTPPKFNPAGDDYSFSQWTAGTKVTLTRVPWSSDYKDVVDYPSREDLDNFLFDHSNDTVKFDYSSPVYPGMPVSVDVPFSRAYKYNYVRVENPAYPGHWPEDETGVSYDDSNTPTVFYYFINDIKFSSQNATILNVQLDVWQTFKWYVKFGRAYIERGHLGIANGADMTSYGRNYLTVPEGLDLGNEYVIKVNRWTKIASAKDKDFAVIVTSSTNLCSDPGTVNDPKLNVAQGSQFENLPNGCDQYYFKTVDDYITAMRTLSTTPWITDGIQSATAVPGKTVDEENLSGALTINGADGQQAPGICYRLESGWNNNCSREIITLYGFRDYFKIPNRYRNLHKFQTYPYSLIELTTNTGTPIILKPECIHDSHIRVQQLAHIGQPSPRILYYPLSYNTNEDSDPAWMTDNNTLWVDNGEFFDMSTGINNLPTFSITNNQYINYMASNKNSIAYQYTNADWSQQRALGAANKDFAQASMGMGTQGDLAANQINANYLTRDNQNFATGAKGVVGTVAGVANAFESGIFGATQALQAAGNAVIDINQTSNQTAISNNLIQSNYDANMKNAGFTRDTNLEYAKFAAAGDYANAIAGINAKVQDAKMIQPTVSGQVGGEAFNLATIGWMLITKVKTIDPQAMTAIGEFWLRYGYAINRFHNMDNLNVMQNFTYWKVKELYITSAVCPEQFKNTLRGIFEKGVTVWRNAQDIATIDIGNNDPLPGIGY